MKNVSALCLVLLLGVSAPCLAGVEGQYGNPDKGWSKGPIKWILSKDEAKAYKKLKTDEDRAAYVERFWEERDPTPGTPQNEYEEVFWKRVESAETSFTTQFEPGCLTDFGRVFLLLGPPTDTANLRYQVWTYEPDEATGITETLTLRFASQQTGVLLLDRKPLEKYVAAHPETRGIGWKPPAPQGIAAGVLVLPSGPVAQHVEDDSPESHRQIPILKGVMNRESGPTDVPFEIAFDNYKTADESTLVVITVQVPREAAHGAGETALLPFARLEPLDGDGPALNITGEAPFAPAPGGDHPPQGYVYQARRNLKPGSYKLAIIVEDKVVPNTMGSEITTLKVPSHTGSEFSSSTVSLLWKFEPAQQEPSLDVGAEPDDYVLGGFRLVPQPIHRLKTDGVLAYYFQIYNPGRDSTTGEIDLEVTYQLHLKRAEVWKKFGQPVIRSVQQVELYAIDVKNLLLPNLPLPADYRLEIDVLDKSTGSQLKREILFTVE